MKHAISGDAKEMDIVIDQLGGKSAMVLEALQECAEGRCSCPTPQYERLSSIDIKAGEDEVRVRLKAKVGEAIARADIERCLDHTMDQATGTEGHRATLISRGVRLAGTD